MSVNNTTLSIFLPVALILILIKVHMEEEITFHCYLQIGAKQICIGRDRISMTNYGLAGSQYRRSGHFRV